MKITVVLLLLISFLFNFIIPYKALSASLEKETDSSIAVLSNVEGASVYIDKQNTELITPLTGPLHVNSGVHDLRVEKEGFSTWRKKVLLTPGENLTVHAILIQFEVTDAQNKAFGKMKKKPITKTWWFRLIVVAGVGVALFQKDVDSDDGTLLVTW